MNIRGVSTALYGWMERFHRDGLEWNWDTLYGVCAEAGFDAVETDALPEKLGIARGHGLAVSASYIGMALHVPFKELDIEGRVMPIAERLAHAGGSDLLLNADQLDWSAPVPKGDDAYKRQGENMSRIAELVQPLGLRVSMHNHAHDHAGAIGDLRSVIDYADASVGLCIDTGWAYVAGCDPFEWLRLYGDRVFAFHLRNQWGKVPSEDLLEGDLDMRALLQTVIDIDYDGWLGLELWHPETMQPSRSMVEAARRSADFVRSCIQ